eukprot:COSAG01_NODE_48317_length_382_cov_1.229682_1_plen_38_part_01
MAVHRWLVIRTGMMSPQFVSSGGRAVGRSAASAIRRSE